MTEQKSFANLLMTSKWHLPCRKRHKYNSIAFEQLFALCHKTDLVINVFYYIMTKNYIELIL